MIDTPTVSGWGGGEFGTDSKYRQQSGVVFLTGIEAIIRLLLEKQLRDQTVGDGEVNQTFISGYEGSPLGGLDLKVVESLDLLNARGRTVHQFGVNEKTAASAMLGSQYAPGNVDAFWYGKAHGTMWIPDEVWLANLAGSSGRGSMVLLCGEDHRSKSSVSPGTSDWVLRSSMVPVFYPASVSDILKLGMHAIQLSRYLGVVTALKLVTPLCDGASTVNLDSGNARPQIQLPDPDFRKQFHRIVMALGALPMQKALVEDKLPLVEEYVRINQINTIHDVDAGGDVGIIATGKSYTDVRAALKALGLRIPLLQLAVTYPLDGDTIRRFAIGRRRIFVVEEPGPFVEDGVKAALWRGGDVESVQGQYDAGGNPLFPSHGEIDPEDLARRLWPHLATEPDRSNHFLTGLNRISERVYPQIPVVSPMSCGGCPYNVFRDLDEKPGGAIGCSSIRAMEAYDNQVLYIPTMGAGGAIYSGTSAFNGNEHIFQYLGDGSYFHSGRGAVQSCVQADVNITFLLLFNGAVALTGGQQPGGMRPVAEVARELLALGVRSVGVVTEDSQRHRQLERDGVHVFELRQHATALEQFRQTSGTTAIILDKECATEKGRRRRRERIQPDRYVMVNEDICEGCGDCYRQSEGCAALYKIPTEFGDKTQIRQSNCVQDELCVDGECPSFVTLRPATGVGLRRMRPEPVGELPEPTPIPGRDPYVIYAVGRGGTGVVTVSHLIAYAAMMDGKQVYLSNNTGLAQKGGPVEAPIVISDGEAPPAFNRLLPGSADLLLGFDILRAAEPANLKYASLDRTSALVSTTRLPTAEMNRNPDREFPDPDKLADLIESFTVANTNVYLDTYWMSEQLFGDVLYANMLLLGAAYQAGRLPLSANSLEEAVRLNGKQIEENLLAFRWGRLAVADPQRVEAALGRPDGDAEEDVFTRNRAELKGRCPSGLRLHDQALAEFEMDAELQQQFSTRIAELCAYQSTVYADRYIATVRAVWQAEENLSAMPASLVLTRTVMLQLFQLMAYKDEYEVARLATNQRAEQKLRARFDGPVRLSYNLNPPSLRKFGMSKIQLGPWVRPVLRLLSRMKFLRWTRLDPFGFTACRRLERELISWYESCVVRLLRVLTVDNHAQAGRLLQVVDTIRGFEQVKISAAERAVARVEEGLRRLES